MGIAPRVRLLALMMATAGCGCTAQVDPIASLKVDGYVPSVGFSPSGSVLATAGSGWHPKFTRYSSCVTLWDIPSQRALRRTPVPGQVQTVAFSPDGKTLAVA